MIVNRFTLVAIVATFSLVACLSFAQGIDELDQNALMGGQANWRWCNKCEGLHYITDGLGPCPAGGTHITSGSGSYKLINDVPSADGQHGWRYCQNCRGLFHEDGALKGVCPAGGAHDSSASGDYCVIMNSTAAPGQANWRFCYKCRGLFYGGSSDQSACPAGGQHFPGSSNYTVLYETQDSVIWGRVTDSTAKAVAKANVQIKGNTGTKTTKSATDGSYGFTGLGKGKYTLDANKKKVGNATASVRLKNGDAKSVGLVLKK